ncbi:OmpH family outer membrane protein [Marinospirillum perlucidum]|uniref:OmpH family outer membrane protein n=1 Tax=Marinospirillum perlucidum TaxID=1982602 RepID=UPI00138FFC3E|nr:OmpH family outer membrane protein [Marinospirillum perlucidum]
MLKQPSLILTLLIGLFFSLSSQAEESQRIAVLDLQQAMMQTDRISQAFSEIEEQLSNEEASIRQLAEEARSLQQRLQRDGDIMGETERNQLAQQMQGKMQEFQARRAQLQQRQQQMQQQVINDNRPQLEAAINELLEEHNIDILINSQAVHFVKPEFNLTAAVAEKLNADAPSQE